MMAKTEEVETAAVPDKTKEAGFCSSCSSYVLKEGVSRRLIVR